VIYVDNDPVVLAHGRALLAADDTTTVATADLHSPDDVLGARPDDQANRLLQPDIGDGLGEHEHDRQQDRTDREGEAGPPAGPASSSSAPSSTGPVGGSAWTPARRHAAEQRPGDGHGGYGDEQPEREGDAGRP
jgi:hypothetical protein